jgi:crotonobetainyl-CoA:carnitine CoA-transferase CaiB-like acyl-CoA transferase
VTKVEHPETGDPYRSLVTARLHNVYRGFDPFFQSANRCKRSEGLDLKHPTGARSSAGCSKAPTCRTRARRVVTTRGIR